MDDGNNQRLGKYLLKSRLGQGGMGTVYLATDLRLKRDVALKILSAELTADAVAVRRFLREARAIARLNHPNVVAIYDVDELNGCCFLVMELLSGGTAQNLIAHGPLRWEEATAIVAQACRGLVAAHGAGLLHRDIKPANLMRAADGTVKVTDFGLAKIMDPALAAATLALTALDTVVGTPMFMSPEQCKGEQLDPRSDIYSLGATYFTLLTGQPPFPDAPPLQLMFAHCSTPIPDPRALRPEIPATCARIVLTALAKPRNGRFATAQEMLVELERVLAGLPTVAVQLPSGSAARSVPSGEPPTVRLTNVPPAAVSQPPPQRRKVAVVLIALGLLVGSIGLLGWGWSRPTDPGDEGIPVQPLELRTGLPPGSEKAISLQPAGQTPGLKAAIPAVAISPDSKSLFAGSLAGDVCQWDLGQESTAGGDGPPLVRKLSGTTGGIRALALNRRWLVAGGQAKTVWLWKLDSDRPHTALPDLQGEVSALAISPDGRRLAVGTYSEARLYELDDSGARLLKILGTSATGSVKCYMVMSVAFSADSRWLALTSWEDRAISVWEVATGELGPVLRKQSDDPMAVAFLPEGGRVLFGVRQDGVFLWDLKKKTVRRVANSERTAVRSLALTPGGRTAIVSGEWGGSIRLYDLHDNGPGRTMAASTSTGALGLALTPDGRRLATTGGEDTRRGYLQLWNVVPK